ncbi:sulfotransferase [Leptolyngbya iicbica]
MSNPAQPDSQVVIIAGMHRSGTSLTASILQQAGVFIGDELLGTAVSNPKGHFEDRDFLTLHIDILTALGLSSEGWLTTEQLDVPEKLWARAQALCDRRQQTHALWGWKEPRTTLFLDFWKQRLPQAKVVLPYRSPWAVIDSLFTRGDAAFAHHPNFAIAVWLTYNRAALDFYQRYPDDCFLFHCDVLKADEAGFIEKLRHKFALPLTAPEQPLFDPAVMHNQVNDTHRSTLLAHHFPETLEVYAALQQAADLPTSQTWQAPVASEADEAMYQAWMLEDWRANSHCRREKQQLKLEMQQQQERFEAELQAVQAMRDHWQNTVASMEVNRFWQLRNAWVSLKTALKGSSTKPE